MANPIQPPDKALLNALEAAFPAEQILSKSIHRAAFASDASFYRLVPQVVVLPKAVEDVQKLFEISASARIPLCFRAAGTSLSGQAVTDGILVEASRHWRGIEVLDLGARVSVQPGAIGSHVNLRLMPFGRKIGPDPASISACQMGGILANNASGMCCGVAHNAYHTLESIAFVLPSGAFLDTGHPLAKEEFRRLAPELADELAAIRLEILSDPDLVEKIRRKYRIKNTVGYSLNAFLDFQDPLDIFAHLLVGSEGTLGFIARATLSTLESLQIKATGLLVFPTIEACCQAIEPLKASGAAALELMDRACIRSLGSAAGLPRELVDLGEQAVVLLTEFQADRQTAPESLIALAQQVCEGLPALGVPEFTADPERQALIWKVRKGLFPSVGARRNRGTTVVIEDVVLPLENLAEGVAAIRGLLDSHGYADGILFGHAKDGNLHFVISQGFGNQAEIDRYAALMDAVAALVVRLDGSLKGEHGTGRNMAPFVELEWGAEAAQIMKRIKRAADPRGLLNPGVVVSDDPSIHLKSIKSFPLVTDGVDACTECGFCEPVCPSRDLTLSPRQRIVVQREISRSGDPALVRDFAYAGLATCAVDGLCAAACPVSIDTGGLTKELRRRSRGRLAHWTSLHVARSFAWTERGVRFALASGHLAARTFGPKRMAALLASLTRVFGAEIPRWTNDLPSPQKREAFRDSVQDVDAILITTCLSRTMKFAGGDMSSEEALRTVAERAGVHLAVLDVPGFCCGVPFSSKGFPEARDAAVEGAKRALARFDLGQAKIVIDNSPCAEALKSELAVCDSIEFLHDVLLPRLRVTQKLPVATVFPVCSAQKAGLAAKLQAIAEACCERVESPLDSGCCGFAGDRGFLVPELTASACASHLSKVEGLGVSSSRTCEIGLRRATELEFVSIAHLVELATHT